MNFYYFSLLIKIIKLNGIFFINFEYVKLFLQIMNEYQKVKTIIISRSYQQTVFFEISSHS